MLPLVLLLSATSAFINPSAHRQPIIGQSVAVQSLHAVPRCPLMLRGGALGRRSPIPKASADAVAADDSYKPERALQPTAFIFVLSVAIIALVPAQAMVAQLGAAQATRLTSAVSSISAIFEIILAPVVGALSDSFGRKPMLMVTLGAVLCVNVAAAAFPSLALIVASRFVCNLVVGLFFLSAGAILGDAYRSKPASLAAASGTLYALVNGGFAVGIALSRYLPAVGTLRWGYAVSSVAAAIACGYAALSVRETMPVADRLPFKMKAFNPVSCVRLLQSGREMRLLALLLALTLQPIFMGDVLQVFAISEWSLQPGQIATFFTLIPVLGALGNVLGGRCVKLIGVQAFTALATVSNMIFWAGCCISHQAALIGAGIGFLGPARTLGASTALTTLGSKKGIPQGQLSGDRSNLIAILKVLGPAVYGALYARGKAIGLPTTPFLFNLLLTFAALCLGPFALASTSEEAEKGK